MEDLRSTTSADYVPRRHVFLVAGMCVTGALAVLALGLAYFESRWGISDALDQQSARITSVESELDEQKSDRIERMARELGEYKSWAAMVQARLVAAGIDDVPLPEENDDGRSREDPTVQHEDAGRRARDHDR